MCPANGELESGDAETPVDYLCHVAHLRAHALDLRSRRTATVNTAKAATSTPLHRRVGVDGCAMAPSRLPGTRRLETPGRQAVSARGRRLVVRRLWIVQHALSSRCARKTLAGRWDRIREEFIVSDDTRDDRPDESRKPYAKPQIQEVPLRPEEAVLGACKTASTSRAGAGEVRDAHPLQLAAVVAALPPPRRGFSLDALCVRGVAVDRRYDDSSRLATTAASPSASDGALRQFVTEQQPRRCRDSRALDGHTRRSRRRGDLRQRRAVASRPVGR